MRRAGSPGGEECSLEDLQLAQGAQDRRHELVALGAAEAVAGHELAVVGHQLVGGCEELKGWFVVVVAAKTARLALVQRMHLELRR